jgi:uncharacterized membrane protein
MGVEIEGAMQQAAHAGRHCMGGDCARAIAAMRRFDWTPPFGRHHHSNEIHSCFGAVVVKSVSFGVVHLGIAFGVGYALTGDVAIAGAITLVEPLVNTVAHYFFDRWWGHPLLVARWRALRRPARAAVLA